MDNQNTSYNLDPDKISTQGVVQSAQISTPLTKVIDITPGDEAKPPIQPTVNHVDEAVLPDHKVIDITPNSPVDINPPAITPIVTQQPSEDQSGVEPPVTEQPAPPVSESSTPIPTPPVTVEIPNINVAPATEVSISPTGFQINTSSPLFEDPDQVIIPK